MNVEAVSTANGYWNNGHLIRVENGVYKVCSTDLSDAGLVSQYFTYFTDFGFEMTLNVPSAPGADGTHYFQCQDVPIIEHEVYITGRLDCSSGRFGSPDTAFVERVLGQEGINQINGLGSVRYVNANETLAIGPDQEFLNGNGLLINWINLPSGFGNVVGVTEGKLREHDFDEFGGNAVTLLATVYNPATNVSFFWSERLIKIGSIEEVEENKVERGTSNEKVGTEVALKPMVFPNPGTMELGIKGLISGDKVTVFDIHGQVVFDQSPVEMEKLVINSSSFSNGWYFILIDRPNNPQPITLKWLKVN